MKRYIIKFLFTGLLVVSAFSVFSQDPPPPPGGHNQTNNQPPGGSTPIGSGVNLLIILAAGYGALKGLTPRKNLNI